MQDTLCPRKVLSPILSVVTRTSMYNHDLSTENGVGGALQYHTLLFLFLCLPALVGRHQHCAYRLVKNILQPLLSFRARLEVPHCPDLPRALHALSISHRRKVALSQSLDGDWVFAQVELCSDEDYRDARGVVLDFRDPFGADVFE